MKLLTGHKKLKKEKRKKSSKEAKENIKRV